MELIVLLTHRGNVGWQTGEVCTWRFGWEWVALRLVPRTAAGRLGRRQATFARFPCHSCGHAAVISNAAVVSGLASDAV